MVQQKFGNLLSLAAKLVLPFDQRAQVHLSRNNENLPMFHEL